LSVSTARAVPSRLRRPPDGGGARVGPGVVRAEGVPIRHSTRVAQPSTGSVRRTGPGRQSSLWLARDWRIRPDRRAQPAPRSAPDAEWRIRPPERMGAPGAERRGCRCPRAAPTGAERRKHLSPRPPPASGAPVQLFSAVAAPYLPGRGSLEPEDM